MADVLNRYSDISPRTTAFSVVDLLDRAKYLMLSDRFGQVKAIPSRKSKSVVFRRYEALSLVDAPLAEGVTPAGQALTKTDVQFTLEQFGGWVPITDVVQDTHEDAVLQEAIDILGDQASFSLDKITWGKLLGGTSVYYGQSSATAYTTRLTLALAPFTGTYGAAILKKIKRTFQKNGAQFQTTIVKASVKIATQPVGPCYFAVTHSDVEADIRACTAFVSAVNYADSDKAIEGEIGSIGDFRFCITPLMPYWANGGAAVGTDAQLSDGAVNNNVYPILIFGKNAYGVCPFKGKMAADMFVLNPGVARGGDPLGQRGSAGWKALRTAGILNDAWMTRIEVTATTNP